jgi:hypothetical protein
MLSKFEAIILDMNATFMFGHDRFGEGENYGSFFRKIGGSLPETQASQIISDAFFQLSQKYPDPEFRNHFPSVSAAIRCVVSADAVSESDVNLLVDTFAHHERGFIPSEYAVALRHLASKYCLGLVADIWAPKDYWLQEFEDAGISDIFKAMSFSSDLGIVKPSPIPFARVLEELGTDPMRTVVIGDSARRDLGGASAAGLPCILVGGEKHRDALFCTDSLLSLVQ